MLEPEGALLAGRYLVTEELPRHAQRRRVFRARDHFTGTLVAIKQVPAELVRRELTALMAARLPGVVELLDHWIDDDGANIVTRWIDGAPFPGPSAETWSRLAGPTLALLTIVDRVHRSGVVHRDLKPTNVLVDAAQRPVVLDLGIAQGTGVESHTDDTEDVAGTPRYVAPEQLLGEIDPRSDLYAIGVMVYEALTGRLPHEGPDLVGARLLEPPVPLRRHLPDLDPGIAAAIERLLATRPADRFADAREAARALGGHATSRHLPPFRPSRTQLRGLLRGPERVAHLPTRAAALLWRTTGGARGRLEEALADWLRSGVLDGALRLDPARFAALESADRGAALIRDLTDLPPSDRVTWALTESERALQVGDHDHAIAVLRAVLATGVSADGARALVWSWERHAHALGTPVARQDLLLAARRLGDARLRPVEQVLEAAGRVGNGDIDRALGELEGLDTLAAHVVRIQAARIASVERHREAVERLERWATTPGDTSYAANARGLLHYRESRFQEAGAAHLRAARTAELRSLGLAARLNAAAALLEAPSPGRAAREAGQVLRAARLLRHPGHEAAAEVLLRAAVYRQSVDTHLDLDLLDALETLEMWPMAAFGALTEAAVAWRRRDVRAAELADRAERLAQRAGRRAPELLAGALGVLIAPEKVEARVEALAAAAAHTPPGVAAQAMALLAAATGSADLRERARDLAPWRSALAVRREILSPREVVGADFT